MEQFLVRNAIHCPNCDDVIESRSVHEYVTCKCGECSTDGGLEYIHRSKAGIGLQLYSTDPHEIIREHVKRHGYGKIGASDYGTYRFTLLKDMTDEHLNALLSYCKPKDEYLPIYKNEIEYRKQNNIKIDEI